MKWLDYRYPDSYVNRVRRKRHAAFMSGLSKMEKAESIHILDVGGTYHYWKTMTPQSLNHVNITLLNLKKESLPQGLKGFNSVAGDIRSALFSYDEYDVVFSNSVIEHLGSQADMRKFADRIRQSGKPYYIQTPSKWFPMEPHSRLLFFQFLPRVVRAWMIWHFKINYFPRAETYRDCLGVSDSTIMLSKRQVCALFPEAEIVTERLFGMPKSYTAIQGFPLT